LRRDFVLADEAVRQFAIDLEFNRNQIVATELSSPAGGDECLDRDEVLFTAEGLACGCEDLRRIRCLAKGQERARPQRHGRQCQCSSPTLIQPS